MCCSYSFNITVWHKMSNRKKKLIVRQILLFLVAITLLYVFYYQGDKSENKITVKKIEKEIVENENVSNFFEDVEYKGIDANGNRYKLQSKKALVDETSPELINISLADHIIQTRNAPKMAPLLLPDPPAINITQTRNVIFEGSNALVGSIRRKCCDKTAPAKPITIAPMTKASIRRRVTSLPAACAAFSFSRIAVIIRPQGDFCAFSRSL